MYGPWSRPSPRSRPAPAAPTSGALPAAIGANYYTPEITQVKLHSKMPLKIRWISSTNLHRESDTPLEHLADKLQCV